MIQGELFLFYLAHLMHRAVRRGGIQMYTSAVEHAATWRLPTAYDVYKLSTHVFAVDVTLCPEKAADVDNHF